MCAGTHETDQPLQNRVLDQLYARGLIRDGNEFTEKYTFLMVRDTIVNYAAVFGQNNPYLDNLKGDDKECTVRPVNESLQEIVKHLRGLRNPALPATEGDLHNLARHVQAWTLESKTPSYVQTPQSMQQPDPMKPYGLDFGTRHIASAAATTGQPTVHYADQQGLVTTQPAPLQRNHPGPPANSPHSQPTAPPPPPRSASPRQGPLKCFNCGGQGHIVRDCLYHKRPYEERRQIQESLSLTGQLPADLPPLVPRTNREVPAALGKIEPTKEAQTRVKVSTMFGHLG
jgi:hypothetical protein